MVKHHEPSSDFTVTAKRVSIKPKVLVGMLSTVFLALGGWIARDRSTGLDRLSKAESEIVKVQGDVAVVRAQLQFLATEQVYTRNDLRDFMNRYGVTPNSPPPSTLPAFARP